MKIAAIKKIDNPILVENSCDLYLIKYLLAIFLFRNKQTEETKRKNILTSYDKGTNKEKIDPEIVVMIKPLTSKREIGKPSSLSSGKCSNFLCTHAVKEIPNEKNIKLM